MMKKVYPSKCRRIARQLHGSWICTVNEHTHTHTTNTRKKLHNNVIRCGSSGESVANAFLMCEQSNEISSLFTHFPSAGPKKPVEASHISPFRFHSHDNLNHGVNNSENGQTHKHIRCPPTHTERERKRKIHTHGYWEHWVDCYWFWLARFFAFIHVHRTAMWTHTWA